MLNQKLLSYLTIMLSILLLVFAVLSYKEIIQYRYLFIVLGVLQIVGGSKLLLMKKMKKSHVLSSLLIVTIGVAIIFSSLWL